MEDSEFSSDVDVFLIQSAATFQGGGMTSASALGPVRPFDHLYLLRLRHEGEFALAVQQLEEEHGRRDAFQIIFNVGK